MSEKTIGQRIAALCESIDKFWRDRDSLDHVSVSTLRTIAAELDMPMDNGDGTVTTCVPVTVSKQIVADGSRVVAVRPHKPGERFIVVRVILSDPPTPPFEAGKYYRTRGGEVVGPIWQLSGVRSGRKWACEGWIGWFANGHVDDGTESDGDLLPGEVTVWQPPVSLKAGTYHWQQCVLTCYGATVVGSMSAACLADWSDPPKSGRYKVPGGGKVAIWEDES